MTSLMKGAALTMSSREIAELTGKRHDNVKRTIETLAGQGVIAFPQIEEKPSTGGRPAAEYVFSGDRGKRDSIVVVAQLSPEFTARLVDRWQELESRQSPAIPQSYPEALRLAAELVERNSHLQLVVSEQAPKVEVFERIASATGSMCITDAAKHLGIKPSALRAWLQENRWIFRRHGSARWLAYQPRLESGVLVHRITPLGLDDNGDERAATQVRVTAKGLTVLAQRLSVAACGGA